MQCIDTMRNDVDEYFKYLTPQRILQHAADLLEAVAVRGSDLLTHLRLRRDAGAETGKETLVVIGDKPGIPGSVHLWPKRMARKPIFDDHTDHISFGKLLYVFLIKARALGKALDFGGALAVMWNADIAAAHQLARESLWQHGVRKASAWLQEQGVSEQVATSWQQHLLRHFK